VVKPTLPELWENKRRTHPLETVLANRRGDIDWGCMEKVTGSWSWGRGIPHDHGVVVVEKSQQ
jgi:hypothetical protein